jgi:hypothetical protein
VDSEDTEAQEGSKQDERELIESITPDVMNVLTATGFFAALDDRLCPADSSVAAEKCRNTYKITSSILQSKDFPDEDIQDVISVMRTHGGYCDCEILYNVVETNRLKAKHWQARARDRQSDCQTLR